MPLSAGDKLGPYEIVAPIGVGGMGEVYHARDTRLNRVVAIKVSKEQFSERSEREARAVAALNHQHICQLYDVGTLPDGAGYLVMEFVKGAPLKGPFKLEKETDPTLTELTGQGQIVGTLQYMSPEQLQGRKADARSDLFSFGCVMYKMLTGKHPFEGESPAVVMAAILERDPAPLKTSLPLDRVLKRCLAKDPDQRFQTAVDLKAALSWAVEQPAASEAPASRRRAVQFRPIWMGACALAVAGIALLGWRDLAKRPGGSWSGLLLGGPEVAMTPRISPDGHTLAFLAMERGLTQVAVMKPDTGNWTVLTHERNAGPVAELNWSSDGNTIYFDRQADVPLGIFSVPAVGGEEQRVLEDADRPEPLTDGSLLVVRLSPERELRV
jgi:eukaryotic-like serine/threonine-protein kinase